VYCPTLIGPSGNQPWTIGRDVSVARATERSDQFGLALPYAEATSNCRKKYGRSWSNRA